MPEERTLGGEFEPIPRRKLHLFFLIDCSGSMFGGKIGTVNQSMRDVLLELNDAGGADADVSVAVLLFSSGCRWMTAVPQAPDKLRWEDVEADGVTDLGEACMELERKLSRDEFIEKNKAYFKPVIILLSDGDPTDDYKKGLEALNKNNWFKNSTKIALPIGKDANRQVMAEFTGNVEYVLKEASNPAELRMMLRAVSVSSTSFASRSSTSGVSQSDALVEELHRIQDNPDDYVVSAPVGVDIPDYEDEEWD